MRSDILLIPAFYKLIISDMLNDDEREKRKKKKRGEGEATYNEKL
jgi:hypothetical protein